MLALGLMLLSGTSTFRPSRTGISDETVRDYIVSHSRAGRAVPSFSRQTGLTCNVCHTAIPQLTPFGRLFKLNGYTLTGMQTVQTGDSGRPSLRLDLIPPLSAMVIGSVSSLARAEPGTQNGNAQLPQELSVFLAGAITPRLGTFLQVTYDPEAGGIGIDNLDVRFATRAHLGRRDLLLGLTLNNNPTVQDLWNSIPAWGFPFASSAVAPAPAAAPLVVDALAQNVAGLGGYALCDNTVYLEATFYRSAAQGGPQLPDGSSANTLNGVAPYGRLALQHQWGRNDLMLGAYGLHAAIYPSGVSGPRDRYTDLAADAQYERVVGGGSLTLHGTLIHERQTLDAAFASGAAANRRNTLDTFRADAEYTTAGRVTLAAGLFDTWGTRDRGLYQPGPVDGSASGRPASTGVIGEIDYLPCLNTRLALQYTAYTRFNGGTSDYDGAGRRARDNNTLYLVTWLAF